MGRPPLGEQEHIDEVLTWAFLTDIYTNVSKTSCDRAMGIRSKRDISRDSDPVGSPRYTTASAEMDVLA